MTTSRRPQAGQVELTQVFTSQSPPPSKSRLRPLPGAGPQAPGAIFKRSDTPFSGEGTHVILTAVRGITRRGMLTVPFRFQIPPLDGWQRSFSGRWNPFDVVGGANGPRERSRFGGPGLRTVNFRTMFLDWHPSWGVWEPDVLAPILAVREIERLSRLGVIFRLRLRNTLYAQNDVNMLATIIQGDVEETSGEPDTRYLTLSFQEYDELTAERKAREDHGSDGPWTHTVVEGDTLYKLARRYYKEQALWPAIANANAHLGAWAPSRNLQEWAKRYHKKRVRIPIKPKTTNKGKAVVIYDPGPTSSSPSTLTRA